MEPRDVTRNRQHTWGRHPGVRSGEQLTAGERAADRLRDGMGSWTFVLLAVLFLGVWMLGNRNEGFDPYPFILLNLVLSCVAALQGAILLIAARRSDQVSGELAVHDFQTDTASAAMLREALDELARLRHDLAALAARLDGTGATMPPGEPRG